MIPYWPQPVWVLGPWTIHAFGLAQAMALTSGYVLALQGARRMGLEERRTGGLFVVAVFAGLAAGYLVHHVTSGAAWTRPGESLTGLSAGALAVAAAACLRWGSSVLPHLDVLASVAPVVGGIARFGCFLAHDHRGRASSGPFAVRFPEGPRLDLGLIECVVALAAAWPIWWLWRSRPAAGVVTAVVVVSGVALRVGTSYLA